MLFKSKQGELTMKKKITILLTALAFGLTGKAVEILSLDYVLNNGKSSSEWNKTAFYQYSGSGGLEVLQVIPGNVLGNVGGVLVHVPQRGFMSSDMTIFIRGTISGVVDHDKLPSINLKLDGTYQYTTTLGAVSTVRAFRKLTEQEEGALYATLRAIAEKKEAQRVAERKALQDTISKRIQDMEAAYFEEQALAKKETEEFFSTLEIDLLKDVYIEKALLLWVKFEVRPNVKLDELKKAKDARDWIRCVQIAYDEFYSDKRKLAIDWDMSSVTNIFEQLKSYDFVGNEDGSYRYLFDAQDMKEWNRCVNIAAQILKQAKDGTKFRFDADDEKIFGCPGLPRLRKIFTSLQSYEFPCDITDNKPDDKRHFLNDLCMVSMDSDWVSEVEWCSRMSTNRAALENEDSSRNMKAKRIAKQEPWRKHGQIQISWYVGAPRKRDSASEERKSSIDSLHGHQNSFSNFFEQHDSRINRREACWSVRMHMMPRYIVTKQTLEEIDGSKAFRQQMSEFLSRNKSASSRLPKEIEDLDLCKKVKMLQKALHNNEIGEADYKHEIIAIHKTLGERMSATFTRLDKSISGTGNSRGQLSQGESKSNKTQAETSSPRKQAQLADYVRNKFGALNFNLAANTWVDPKWRNLIVLKVQDSWPREIEELIRTGKSLELINAVVARIGKIDVKYTTLPDEVVIDELYSAFINSLVDVKIMLADTAEGANIRKNDTRNSLGVFFLDKKMNWVPPLNWSNKWSARFNICAFGESPARIFVLNVDDIMPYDDYSKGIKSFAGSEECEKFVSQCIKHTCLIKQGNCSYQDGKVISSSSSAPGNKELSHTPLQAKEDKGEFARIWKTILSSNPSGSKLEQDISRLRKGMGNEALAKIYDKYMEKKCTDVRKEFVDAVSRCTKESELDEVRRVYKEEFLTRLSERMNQIITGTSNQKESVAGSTPQSTTRSTVPLVKCPECDGGRYIKDESVCMNCSGQGKVEKVKLGLNGTTRRTISNCSQCLGTGVIIKKKPCTTCKGKGKVRAE